VNETADEITVPPPPPSGRRGVYLRRHHARVIEDGNLLVVEFLDHERGAGSAAAGRPVPVPDLYWPAARTWAASLSAVARALLRLR